MSDKNVNLIMLNNVLPPLGYSQDEDSEGICFVKQIKHKDLRSAYAFSVVMVTMDDFTIRIEGLNEPRLRRAVRAGLIKIESEEDVDALKEVVFETTLDQPSRLKTILPFLEKQLITLEQEPIHTDAYKKALSNIELLVEAANSIDL